MLNLPRSFVLLFAGLALLSACNVPQGAGNTKQILAGADSPDADFAVHFVSRATLPELKSWTKMDQTKTYGWIEQSRGPSSQIIEPGDMIDLSIWDNEESSLLAQPQQKVVSLKGMTVSPSGTVFLPYIDDVYIAKMSPDKARAAIQAKFVGIIPSAQVQISHMAGRESSVDLVSGVSKPGNFVLPDRNFSVMGLIAAGGGIPESMVNPQVRLSRDGKLYGISKEKLLANPKLDTTLRGGDKVYVESDQRYFLSLGAAGKEAQFPFPDDNVSALDAMAIVGGLNDSRANAKGILVLRTYPDSMLRPDGTGPSKDRTIFALDLTTADGLFSAGEFVVQDKDLVLVTESPINAAESVIGLVYSALGIGIRAVDIR